MAIHTVEKLARLSLHQIVDCAAPAASGARLFGVDLTIQVLLSLS
jgi:hypothetical protein